MAAVDDQDALKRAAGVHAASYVTDGMRVGLGTGSTVRFTIEAIAAAGVDVDCTATSVQTRDLAVGLGLRVVAPDALGALDLAIDGADEVDPALNLTKGGGGALTREKVVAQMAARFVVVADESKLVDVLGGFGTPLEVLDFAPGAVEARLRDLGAASVSVRDVRSDNANLLVDARFGATITDPVALGTSLSAIAGVVEHGLFYGDTVERVVVAGTSGIRELTR
ncbi:MAG: ribose-5-phosphate isomerase RpiA [Acidimicrobiia bacterium]|nr:ribose-5-phosphate isomerase RpiA [Acidimicrobiia bacterium]